jgi:NADH-quinone oxidoreductase subunit F
MLSGQGSAKDIALMQSVADQINGKTLCAFGDAAATPVLTTLKWFKPEFEAYARGNLPVPADYRSQESASAEATARLAEAASPQGRTVETH